MLTDNDLLKIQKLIRSEVAYLVKKEVEPLWREIRAMKEEIAALRQDVDLIQNNVKELKKDMRKVKSDIGVIISYFDNNYINLEKRVDIIEDHLKLSQAS